MAKASKARTVRKPVSMPPAAAGVEIPHERLMASIVNELARSRVRHRALLDLLEARGLIEIAEYVDRYRLEEERDFKPFVELLLLSPEEFKQRWGEWIAANAERFGYDGGSRVSVSLATAELAPKADAPKRSSERKNIGDKDHVYIERRPDGKYAVMPEGNERASGLYDTRAEAIAASKRMFPDVKPDVER